MRSLQLFSLRSEDFASEALPRFLHLGRYRSEVAVDGQFFATGLVHKFALVP